MATLLEKCNNIKNDKKLNLKPENLKAGVTCLGVTGTLEELDTSNATATASDIADGKTAYVNGELITGNVFTVGSNANYGGMGNLTVEDDANYSRIEVKHRFNMKTLFTEDGKASFYPSYDSVAEAIGLTADQILKGNTVLGIEGIAEAGDNSNIKVFNTIEEMNAVEDGQEGDLAIIYGRRWTQMSHDLAFNAMEFPDTIELTEPVPDWANSCYFAPAAYETENSADVTVSYDTSTITVSFHMDATAAEETFITYTSTDGLLFTADRADNRILNLPNDVMATSIDVWILDHNKIAKINAKTADIYMFYEDYGMTGWENISNTTNAQEGLDTSDATAAINDIIQGKTAYVNGEKIIGTIIEHESGGSSDFVSGNMLDQGGPVFVSLQNNGDDVVIRKGGYVMADIPYYRFITAFNITKDKIAAGTTLFGLEGTAGGGAEKYAPTHLSFAGSKETSIALNSNILLIDFSNITDTSYMFANCKNLTSITEMYNLPTENVTDMEGMFKNCTGFNSLDLSHMDWSSVTNTSHMFDGCTNVSWINMYSFNGFNITNSEGMFDNCPNLTTVQVGTQAAADMLLSIKPDLNISMGA